MIDMELIRRNPALFKRAIAAKRISLDLDRLLQIDEERRLLVGEISQLRQKRNTLSELVATTQESRQANIDKSKTLGQELGKQESRLQAIEIEFAKLTALVPGLPCEDIPEGDTDASNLELRRWGQPKQVDFELKDHLQLAQMHGMVNFAGARSIAGSRAFALTGNGALLELALLRFAFDRVLDKGFIPVLPPLMVNSNAMFGTGYFPIGEENAYALERDNLFLTGTSEVGIVSMHMNTIFDQNELPKRFVGISPCFRREAGAAGRDTKGLYRMHQFQKVEQVVFCINDPLIADQEHLALLQNAEEIMQALELPYRIVLMCTGELGLGQARKHDIETWMPSRNAYGETHSCSSFYDFQARRLNIKYVDTNGRKAFIYTANNTAIASPRILIAFLENHQSKNGSINIPTALQPYLGGKKTFEPHNI